MSALMNSQDIRCMTASENTSQGTINIKCLRSQQNKRQKFHEQSLCVKHIIHKNDAKTTDQTSIDNHRENI